MAQTLVEAMAMKFEPDEFRDDYKKAIDEIVAAKVQGKEDLIEAPEVAAETTVVDLMAALKASVERAKKGEKARPKGGRASREATAERTRGQRPPAKRKTA